MSGVCSILCWLLQYGPGGSYCVCYIFCGNCQCCVLHHTVVPPGVVLGGDFTKGDGTGGECSPGGMYQLMHIYSNSTLLMIWPMKHVLC